MAEHGVRTPYLREWRKYRLLTQSELADVAEVGRTTIARGEAGEPINIASVRKLAKALGITAERLVRTSPEGKEAA